MAKSKLEQKYDDLEKRISKIETYLRDKGKWHEKMCQLIHESQEEFSQEK